MTVDGHDVRGVTLASLRGQIGIVLQEALLFSGAVRDNIAYGKPDATQAEVEAAARAAQADEFIQRAAARLRHHRRRARRRALGRPAAAHRHRPRPARRPAPAILDDSTSAVDAETESLIQEALDRLMRDSRHTAFVIAQRISTVRDADLHPRARRGHDRRAGHARRTAARQPALQRHPRLPTHPRHRRTRHGRGLRYERRGAEDTERERRENEIESECTARFLSLSFSLRPLRLSWFEEVYDGQAMRVAAETAEERARHRGATARRLVGELAPYRARIADRLRLHRRRGGGAGGGAVADQPGHRPATSCAAIGAALTRIMLAAARASMPSARWRRAGRSSRSARSGSTCSPRCAPGSSTTSSACRSATSTAARSAT